MKVTLTQDGGLAGAIQRPSQVLDSSLLSATEVNELTRLVQAAKTNPSVPEIYPGKARDVITYSITIDGGTQTINLSQSDADMSTEFGELLNWIARHA
jgi:hypothetical protein